MYKFLKHIIKYFACIYFLLNPSLILQSRPPQFPEKDLSKHLPRIIRTCCTFGTELTYGGVAFAKRTDIISVSELGKHSYLGGREEGNGIIYTHRGGFIDIAHLRDCADWTAFLYCLIHNNIRKNNWDIFNLGNEGGEKKLHFINTNDIDTIIAYQLAAKIAYDLSLWHEISTWFGASYIPLLPERYSSFSPEDLFSNLLGVHLAVYALKSELFYEEAMTKYINWTMDTLVAVKTYDETFDAMEKVENSWWSNEKSLPSRKVLLKRYFGNDDFLLPWLVQNKDNENSTPFKLKKPDISLNSYYQLLIKLNYKFPLKTILNIEEKRLISQNDFNVFINFIIRDDDALNARDKTKKNKRKIKKKQLNQ